MQTKQELRRAMRAGRDAIPEAELRQRSELIRQRLLAVPEVGRAESFFVYISYRSEVQTWPLIESLLSAGKMVTVPKTLNRTEMEAHMLKDLSSLQPGIFGLPTPVGNEAYGGKLDLCLAPGLAFTTAGDRLGYGQGHYDRFLEKHPDMTVVGLAFESQIVSHLPREPTDRRMDLIVTEDRVIRPAAG